MAWVLGKVLAMVIRVLPSPMDSRLTAAVITGNASLGDPSSLAKPSRKAGMPRRG